MSLFSANPAALFAPDHPRQRHRLAQRGKGGHVCPRKVPRSPREAFTLLRYLGLSVETAAHFLRSHPGFLTCPSR